MTVRFAPSPTGFLHLGNARVALFNYLLVLSCGGRFILRIDDTGPDADPSYEDAIEEDLRWLGIKWDEKHRQSERRKRYLKAFERLVSERLVYPCFCSKEDLERERRLSLKRGLPPRYSGRCSRIPFEEAMRRAEAGEPCCWRFRIPRGRVVAVEDAVRGRLEFDADSFGDFVIRRSDGSFLYLFTSSVDDGDMGVDIVIRGEDHLSNAPLQVLVMEALGYAPPKFAHLPLMVDERGRPYSKSESSPSVRSFRDRGFFPEAICLALFSTGRGDFPDAPISLREMALSFDLSKYGLSKQVLPLSFIERCNRIYMMGLPLKDLVERFAAFCGVSISDRVEKFVKIFRENAVTLHDLCVFYKKVVEGRYPVLSFSERERVVLKEVLEASSLEELESRYPKGKLYRTLRRAITGDSKGPPLADVISLIGWDEVKNRVKKQLEGRDGC